MSSWKANLKPVALAVAMLPAFTTALAQSVPASGAENGRLWFVELAGKPVADGASLAAVQAEKAAFRAAARAAGINYVERRSFDTLFNGLSIEVSTAERAKLAKVAGVRALYPVETIQAPDPVQVEGSLPDLVAAINLTGVNIAHSTLGLSGAGVKVAIIDSGVDIDHPAFGGTGVRGTTPFPNARIYAGYDLVGDLFNAAGLPSEQIPAPDGDPRDCAVSTPSPTTGSSPAAGHGTHVAGIVGANGGGLLGVAPEAKLAAYRVFGCWGSTTADIMIAAMERALADGVQVINMSIGAARQWPQYPTAVASSRLAQKGIVVVASIGNNGPGGSSPDALFAAGAPGVGESVIGVASFDNAQRSFKVGGVPYGFNSATGSPTAPTSGSLPMSKTGTPTTTNDGCAALPAGSLTGTAVLIRRGTCAFHTKALNAQNAGAAAVVLYNNAAGAINPTVVGSPPITIPVVAITAAQGSTLNGLIAAGATTLEWTGDYVGHPFGTGGLISGFSSFGLPADLSFKPNIGAPGGSIRSAYPLELGSAASLSGTSMSSPHVAGAAALILQAVPSAALGKSGPLIGRSTPPAVNMLTRMQNTAKPKNWSGNPDLGLLEHAFRQGAGMLDVVAAVQSQQFVVPGQIANGESEGGAKTHKLTIRNDSASPVSYTMGHVAGVAAAPNSPGASAWLIGGVFDAPATVSFSSPTVVVPAKGMASVNVTIDAHPGLAERSLYGGYVTLTPTGAGTPLRVPFAGMKGDYQTTQLLRPTANGYPWLTTLSGTTYTNRPGGWTYSMVDANNIPYIILQLAHQARTLKLEALDATSGDSRGVISQDEFVGRNSTPSTGSFFAFAWDGTTSMGTQPDGTYRIRVSALKPLGDAANPAHWETFTSPIVTIARP